MFDKLCVYRGLSIFGNFSFCQSFCCIIVCTIAIDLVVLCRCLCVCLPEKCHSQCIWRWNYYQLESWVRQWYVSVLWVTCMLENLNNEEQLSKVIFSNETDTFSSKASSKANLSKQSLPSPLTRIKIQLAAVSLRICTPIVL